MTTSPRQEDRPVEVRVTDDMLRVRLADGREISTPLAWYPRLAAASQQALNHYQLGLMGIHWPEIDEDLSVIGMLHGVKPSVKAKISD